MSSAKKFQGYNQRQRQAAATAATTIAHVKLLAAAKISQWHKGVASPGQQGSKAALGPFPCRDTQSLLWPSRGWSGVVWLGLVCAWPVLGVYSVCAHISNVGTAHTLARRHLLLLAHRAKRTIVHCVLASRVLAELLCLGRCLHSPAPFWPGFCCRLPETC